MKTISYNNIFDDSSKSSTSAVAYTINVTAAAVVVVYSSLYCYYIGIHRGFVIYNKRNRSNWRKQMHWSNIICTYMSASVYVLDERRECSVFARESFTRENYKRGRGGKGNRSIVTNKRRFYCVSKYIVKVRRSVV